MYEKLVAKVGNIDTSGFVLKTKYDVDKSGLQKKIPYNEITEIENKIASVTGLNTNAALTAAENEISDVSNLVKRNRLIQKYQTLNLSILPRLIIINLLKILLIIT